MLNRALELCGAAFGALWIHDGERMHAAATNRGMPPMLAEFLTRSPYPVGSNNAHARLLQGEPVVHLADIADDEAYRSGDPLRRALVELGHGRTMLAVPLRKDGAFLGDFVIYRTEVKPFSDKQIPVLQNFAAQAVIAMENARLLGELQECTHDLQQSLEYQTATSDVLNVISRSTFDLEPILQTVAETAARLCEAEMANIWRREGESFRAAVGVGFPPEYIAFRQTYLITPCRGALTGRVALEGRTVHIIDSKSDPEYAFSEALTLAEIRTQLG
jgi:two-component system NtrC family sensor kinase